MGRMLGAGALAWVLYAVASVAVNGVVLDEALPPAQVIAGAVHYPAGHPHEIFSRRAFSLSYDATAVAWRVVPDATVVCGVRNVLFLALSAFVPYALALVLTRRPLWGLLAAVLTLSETACSFIGVYLSQVFPGFYTSGHLGIHAVALTAVLLLAGVWRSGGLLVGLLPGIHAAMAVVGWPWAAAYLLGGARPGRPVARVVPWVGGGLAVCAALAVAIVLRTAGDAPLPVDPAGTAASIYETFRRTTDPHRQPIELVSGAYLVAPTAFAVVVVLLALRRARDATDEVDRSAAAWIAALGAIAWVAVYVPAVAQALGPLPAPVAMLMHGRYANVATLLILPLSVAVIAAAIARLSAREQAAAAWLVSALVAAEAALLVVARRVAFLHLVYAVLGFALALDWHAHRARRRDALVPLAGLGAIAAALLVLGSRSFGEGWEVVTLAGAALGTGLAMRAGGGRLAPRGGEAALATACAIAALAALPGPHVMSEWDAGAARPSAYERRLATWLAEHARSDDMLVAPLWPPTWLQAKTGHPVAVDLLMLANMAYMPSLAAPLGAMVRDLYGVDYADAAAVRLLLGPDGMLRPSSPAFLAAWPGRPCAAWAALARTYQFAFVLSPASVRLDLPAVLPGPEWTLHRVPDGDGCEQARRG